MQIIQRPPTKDSEGPPYLIYAEWSEIILQPFCVGIALSSQAVASQVFSALMSLTSVFGMGTGGPSSPLTPTKVLL